MLNIANEYKIIPENSDGKKSKKVNKSEFLKMVAIHSSMDSQVLEKVYNVTIENIVEKVYNIMIENSDEKKPKKVNKSEFLKMVAIHSGIDLQVLEKVYNVTIEDIIRTVYNIMIEDIVEKVYNIMIEDIALFTANGYKISLAGFGTFSVKTHKGHPVQFKKTNTQQHDYVGDYTVLKFSASDIFAKKIKDIQKQLNHV